MPVRIRYNNDSEQECTIRPTPLWSVDTNILKTPAGEAFGVNYTITLTGTIIADLGSPYALDRSDSRFEFFGEGDLPVVPNQIGPYGAFDNNVSHFIGASQDRPPRQKVHNKLALQAILSKQKSLRALFAKDGQRLELTDWEDEEASIICYPRVTNITFSEGIYVDTAQFTITLEADTLLDKESNVNAEGGLIAPKDWTEGVIGLKEQEIIDSLSGAFISDFSESWSIEVDEQYGESPEQPFSYRISRQMSATGKTHYGPNSSLEVVKQEAWKQAKKYIQDKLYDGQNVSGIYPNNHGIPSVLGYIGSGSLNLIDKYKGFNHIRSENIDPSNGSYSISDNWIIATGTSFENYSMSISNSLSGPFVGVSIEGTIKGLSDLPPSGFPIGRDNDVSPENILSSGAYANAIKKYNEISNNGNFGLTSDIYKRANNLVAVQLNSQPISVSVGTNQYTSEINYNLEFDNRPSNFISGVLTEDISISDTYPGDRFAVIPVIGRPTGPVLQYIGGRSEYTRDLQLTLNVDYTQIPYVSGRNPILLKKPSVVQPMANQIAELVNQVSPEGEPGVRKWFLNAPRENWEPKTGGYSLSLSWVYELDK